MEVTLTELVARFGGELVGDGARIVRQVAPLDRATIDEIGFVSQHKYLAHLGTTQAGAVILPLEARDAVEVPRILTANPYLYFARVSALLNPSPRPQAGIHPAATVAADASVATDASIGAGAVIGARARIGSRTVVGANCVIGNDASIGADSWLHANVTVYPACEVGEHCILHSSCVIGSDGFGFAPDEGRWEKIPQIGRVLIGDHVEIGASTTIDRGALEDTVIEEGVKIDNLVQVAHNVRIGAHTAIAACTGIAGSANIGSHCLIGGAAMIIGHIDIADGTRVSTNTLITKSLKKPGTYTSSMPFSEHDTWQKNAVHMRNLDKLVDRIKQLEKRLNELERKS